MGPKVATLIARLLTVAEVTDLRKFKRGLTTELCDLWLHVFCGELFPG